MRRNNGPPTAVKHEDAKSSISTGRRLLDMSTMGIGACLLGFNDPDVTEAVVNRVQSGSMCTLNYPEEVELAELLLQLHPWAEQVRYARTGGEAMAVAVRIAAPQRSAIESSSVATTVGTTGTSPRTLKPAAKRTD